MDWHIIILIAMWHHIYMNDNQFATKENCTRLFILIDAMTEIYIYEARQYDHRFDLGREDTDSEVKLYVDLMLSNTEKSPEHILLGINV